jgi:uncharacterized protein
LRTVLDTNVLVSAFTATGVCHDLYAQALLTQQLITSEVVLRETRRVLRDKFKYSADEVTEAIANAASDAEIVSPEPLRERLCDDADDDWVLASAVGGRAEIIVTGDDDLLVLKKYGDIRILSPRQFLELLDRRP